MAAAEVSEKLQLKEIKDKAWYIQSCSAISGEGERRENVRVC